MAGRKNIPTNLKILRGNPGKRALNKNEPTPGGMPNCPSHLDKMAKKEWKRFAPILHRLGLLTEVDGPAFAAYCQQYSLWVTIQKELSRQGAQLSLVRKALLEEAKAGNKKAEQSLSALPETNLLVQDYKVDLTGLEHIDMKQNPLIIMARQTLQMIRAYCTEFGMTPSSRGRIQVGTGKEIDPMEEFLKRGNGKK